MVLISSPQYSSKDITQSHLRSQPLFSLSPFRKVPTRQLIQDNVSQLYCEYVSLETVQQGEIPSTLPTSLTKLWTLEKAYGQVDDLKRVHRNSHPNCGCHVE